MRVVITGAAGFLGSHLAEHLLESGDEVVGIDSMSDSYDPVYKERNIAGLHDWSGFQLIQADVGTGLDPAWVHDADVVYHLAGETGSRPSWGTWFSNYVHHNEVTTWRLLDAARGTDLRKFVYASCASVYGAASRWRTPETAPLQPLSPYAVSKAAGEGLCEAYRRTCDVPALSVRLFKVYGARQRPDLALSRLITAAQTRQPFLLHGDGRQTRDLVHVRDVVSALRASALSPRTGVVNVGSGSGVSLLELAHIVGKLVRAVDVVRLPAEPGSVRHCTADITLAKTWLGFQPSTSLIDGLIDLMISGSEPRNHASPLGVVALHPIDDLREPSRP
jgi:nucleoside-diphosphate-sugar epimerase